MSKNIGTLSKGFDAHNRREFFRGTILSRSFTGMIALVPNITEGARKPGTPDFRVKEKYQGRWMECGAAWVKTSGNVPGGEYLSITIDTDDMARPFYCAAFANCEQPTDDLTEWSVCWNRPRGPGGMRQAPAEGPEMEPDDIPY